MSETNDKVREYMKHPVTGEEVTTYEGFSWPGLFFGPFWLCYKSLWKYFLIGTVITAGTLGVGWIPLSIAIGFKGNEWHYKQLAHKGYKPITEAVDFG
ncbi:DUF2628 domain-containing protein [Candidatus Bipolaricaulota bacterium]|nr:DUF2628 domain-containing protein [Candidatus Bipolaricaulota bacterium]